LTHTRARVISIAIVLLNLTLACCVTPETVSKFCGSAAATLTSATPVFNDMKLSCLRAVNARDGLITFKPPTETNTSCTEIGDKAAGAVAAAKMLSHYFSAINALASFGRAKAGTDAEALLSKTGAAVGAGSTAQTALGSIAKFLVTAATGAYQQKQLDKDLTSVSTNIVTVANALKTIVQSDYLGQLDREAKDVSTRYLDFVKDNSRPNPLSPEVRLMLADRWRAEEAAIEAKRGSAQCLISALDALSDGFRDLAANSHSLKAKQLPGLLEPYAAQLQTLVPQIQKAF
jgi:hypothetical protein